MLVFVSLSCQFVFIVSVVFNSCNRLRYGKNVRLPLFAFKMARCELTNKQTSVIIVQTFSFTGRAGMVAVAK